MKIGFNATVCQKLRISYLLCPCLGYLWSVFWLCYNLAVALCLQITTLNSFLIQFNIVDFFFYWGGLFWTLPNMRILIVPLANSVQIFNIDRPMLNLTYAKLSRVADRIKPSFVLSCPLMLLTFLSWRINVHFSYFLIHKARDNLLEVRFYHLSCIISQT